MCDVVNQKGLKPLARSSHSISFIQRKAYIFGGEHLPRYSLCKLVISEFGNCAMMTMQYLLNPGCNQVFTCRTPIDNTLHCFDFEEGIWIAVDAKGTAPAPRVGHTATSIGSALFIFGGRTGLSLAAMCAFLSMNPHIASLLLGGYRFCLQLGILPDLRFCRGDILQVLRMLLCQSEMTGTCLGSGGCMDLTF